MQQHLIGSYRRMAPTLAAPQAQAPPSAPTASGFALPQDILALLSPHRSPATTAARPPGVAALAADLRGVLGSWRVALQPALTRWHGHLAGWLSTLTPPAPAPAPPAPGPVTPAPTQPGPASTWTGDFDTTSLKDAAWRQRWGVKSSWTEHNASFLPNTSGGNGQMMRVRYPAGSASTAVAKQYGRPTGGVGLFATLNQKPADAMRLSYSVRFSENFDFVLGGKLPGLYGGTQNNGGKIPDGTDGFSTRLMWRQNGDGEVYAYLPSSETWGTSLGRGNFRFVPGQWHNIEQEVVLNTPGKKDGSIRLWVDGKPVLDQKNVVFRTTDQLKIDGMLLNTFFGGGLSWATPKDVHADFANFSAGPVNGRAG